MCNKYRVAVAIAVLKSKPTELPVNQYIDKLKDKLNEQMDVDVISINSEDFNFDEEVFNEFNDNYNENHILSHENNDSATILGDFHVHKTNDSPASYDAERRKVSNVLATLGYKEQQVIIINAFCMYPYKFHC